MSRSIRHYRIVLLFTSILVLNQGCRAQKDIESYIEENRIVVGDSLVKSGYIIYDYKKVRAYLLEDTSLDVDNLLETDIRKYISNADFYILLRSSLRTHKTSDTLELTLCYRRPEFLITRDRLIFKRYQFIKIEDLIFLEVDNDYSDMKRRLMFCE